MLGLMSVAELVLGVELAGDVAEEAEEATLPGVGHWATRARFAINLLRRLVVFLTNASTCSRRESSAGCLRCSLRVFLLGLYT